MLFFDFKLPVMPLFIPKTKFSSELTSGRSQLITIIPQKMIYNRIRYAKFSLVSFASIAVFALICGLSTAELQNNVNNLNLCC